MGLLRSRRIHICSAFHLGLGVCQPLGQRLVAGPTNHKYSTIHKCNSRSAQQQDHATSPFEASGACDATQSLLLGACYSEPATQSQSLMWSALALLQTAESTTIPASILKQLGTHTVCANKHQGNKIFV